MSLVDKNFEGPPSAKDMENVVCSMLHDGKAERVERVERIASTMLDYWSTTPHRHDDPNAYMMTFGWWLGVRSAAFQIVSGQRHRSRERFERKLRRIRRGR